jgi:hypothetical protein
MTFHTTKLNYQGTNANKQVECIDNKCSIVEGYKAIDKSDSIYDMCMPAISSVSYIIKAKQFGFSDSFIYRNVGVEVYYSCLK